MTPTGNPQRLRRARRQQLPPETGDNIQPTPTTSAAPATGAEDKHQAQTPQAPPTRCKTHSGDERPDGTGAITPGPPTQPDAKGGGRQGCEQDNEDWLIQNQTTPHQNIPNTAPAPQTDSQAPHHDSVLQAWTARIIAPKERTIVTYRGATTTTSTAPATGAEDGHQAHTHRAPPKRCTAHNGKNSDPPMQRPIGTPTIAPGRPTQPGPTGGGQTEGEQHSDDWGTRNHTTPHRNAPTTEAEPQTEPQAPHRAGKPGASTAQSIAPKNTDYSPTPRHAAQHYDDRDNVLGPEPQMAPLTMEATQPRTPEDHTHEASLSVSSGTSSTALETHSPASTPAEATTPPPESLPSGLDIPVTDEPNGP